MRTIPLSQWTRKSGSPFRAARMDKLFSANPFNWLVGPLINWTANRSAARARVAEARADRCVTPIEAGEPGKPRPSPLVMFYGSFDLFVEVAVLPGIESGRFLVLT